MNRLLLLLLFAAIAPARADTIPARPVHVLEIEGAITPIKARYLAQGIAAAEKENAGLVILRINTPGGLVTSMDEMVSSISNAKVPVAAFVAPRTALAASAGTFLVLASDVAAMAPGARIGSAHPVSGDGKEIGKHLEAKVVNDLLSLMRALARRHGRNETAAVETVRSSINFTAEEAAETGLIDFVVEDEAGLLARIEGRAYVRNGETRAIHVAGGEILRRPPSAVEGFLDALANPTLAAILLSIGIMGIIYEAWSPGVGFGAVVGGIALLLGLISLSQLPIDVGAMLLIILGIVLLVLELKIVSHGLLTVGGISAILLGGMYFVDASQYYGAVQKIQWGVLVPMLVVVGGAFALALAMVARALRAKPTAGMEAMIGREGEVRREVGPAGGLIHVEGALWKATAAPGGIAPGAGAERLEAGARVTVVGVLQRPTRLVVERKKEG